MRMTSTQDKLTISDLSARFGLTMRALRFYEARGLIECERNGRGPRFYTEATAQKLGVICDATALGFTLAEIPGVIATIDDVTTLALSPAQVHDQLTLMHRRLIETQNAVDKLRTMALQSAADPRNLDDALEARAPDSARRSHSALVTHI